MSAVSTREGPDAGASVLPASVLQCALFTSDPQILVMVVVATPPVAAAKPASL